MKYHKEMQPMKYLFLFLVSLSLLFPYVSAYSPADEKPTDLSIWVTIDNATFSINKSNGVARIMIQANGRASPNVHHCGIAFVTVYKNGSTNYNGNFIPGPLNITGKEPLIFMPVNGTWQKWKFYNVVYVEKEKMGINESTLANVSSFEIWVRGYGDEEGTRWNQSYMILTEKVKEEMEKFYSEKGEDNTILYLGIAGIISAMVIVAIYIKRKR